MATQLTTRGLALLLLLSAVWGGSFLFMRMAVAEVGPAWLILSRVGLAALFLGMVAFWFKQGLALRVYWRHYLVLGLLNSALPFLMYAYAAQILSASLLSILNATAPIWAAAMAVVWRRAPLPVSKWVGMGTGLLGVVVLVGQAALTLPPGGGLAIAAGLIATLCYGIATHYTQFAPEVAPFANAHGSMWAATVWVMPMALMSPFPTEVVLLPTGLAVLALGIVCSGIAYLIYFRLVADFGGVSALTVTYLIPVFGTLWGVLFLDEPIGWVTVFGGMLVLIGTARVTDLSWSSLWGRR